MKTNSQFTIILILIIVVVLNGCKSNKPIVEQAANTQSITEETVAVIPEIKSCENEVYSDNNFFRTTSMSTSSDLMLAKEKALLLAKQRLVTIINSNTKSVIDRYVNEHVISNPLEFKQKFENITCEAIDETINNVIVVCETSSILPNRQYKSLVAIEISKEDVLSKISSNNKLQIDYDKKKFEEMFFEGVVNGKSTPNCPPHSPI